jgi:hypothetical protein
MQIPILRELSAKDHLLLWSGALSTYIGLSSLISINEKLSDVDSFIVNCCNAAFSNQCNAKFDIGTYSDHFYSADISGIVCQLSHDSLRSSLNFQYGLNTLVVVAGAISAISMLILSIKKFREDQSCKIELGERCDLEKRKLEHCPEIKNFENLKHVGTMTNYAGLMVSTFLHLKMIFGDLMTMESLKSICCFAIIPSQFSECNSAIASAFDNGVNVNNIHSYCGHGNGNGLTPQDGKVISLCITASLVFFATIIPLMFCGGREDNELVLRKKKIFYKENDTDDGIFA